jgi:hypothetical protein
MNPKGRPSPRRGDSSPASGSVPQAGAWRPGDRREPTERDRGIARRRSTDIIRWHTEGMSNSKIAQRLRVRVSAVDALLDPPVQNSSQQTAIAVVRREVSLPVECIPTVEGPYVPLFRETAPIQTVQFAEIIRRYSEANRLRDQAEQFLEPWEFVLSELERLDLVSEQCEELLIRLRTSEGRLALALEKVHSLEQSTRQWADAYGAKESESARLLERCRQEYEYRLASQRAAWEQASRKTATELAELEAALGEVCTQLRSEQTERAKLGRLFLFVCNERDRLASESGSTSQDLRDAYELIENLVNRIEELSSNASPTSNASN